MGSFGFQMRPISGPRIVDIGGLTASQNRRFSVRRPADFENPTIPLPDLSTTYRLGNSKYNLWARGTTYGERRHRCGRGSQPAINAFFMWGPLGIPLQGVCNKGLLRVYFKKLLINCFVAEVQVATEPSATRYFSE